MRRRQNKEINVYSTSAIDLFASGMGAFIILMVAAIPNFGKVSTIKEDKKELYDENVLSEIERLNKNNNSFITSLYDQTKDIKKAGLQVRALASVNNEPETPLSKLQKVSQTLETTEPLIKFLSQSVETIKIESAKKERKLASELKKEKNERVEIKTQLDLLKNKMKQKSNFVAALLRWDTDKHDLDIQVIDPEGLEQSFKNKSTQVFSDSRVGPGGEMWFLEDPKPGVYTIKVHFHGSYGNKKPSVAKVSLIDRKKVHLLKEVTIQNENETIEVSQFRISEEGVLSAFIDKSKEIKVSLSQ